MKILAMSDLHGEKAFLDPKGADIVVLAGDIAPLRGLSHWDKADQSGWMRREFTDIVSSFPNTEFVFIAGNHDFWGEKMTPSDDRLPKNAHYLKDSGCEVMGIKFWGSPWVPPIGSWKRWAFECSDAMQKRMFNEIPDGIDVLITHTPPMIESERVDIVTRGRYADPDCKRHLGSVELRKAIERAKPKVSVFGHIHTGAHGRTEFGPTGCYNVSILDEDYRAVYEPTEIVIPD